MDWNLFAFNFCYVDFFQIEFTFSQNEKKFIHLGHPSKRMEFILITHAFESLKSKAKNLLINPQRRQKDPPECYSLVADSPVVQPPLTDYCLQQIDVAVAEISSQLEVPTLLGKYGSKEVDCGQKSLQVKSFIDWKSTGLHFDLTKSPVSFSRLRSAFRCQSEFCNVLLSPGCDAEIIEFQKLPWCELCHPSSNYSVHSNMKKNLVQFMQDTE
ncbi:hypothetical protein Bhyg_03945 [Pseudolycoriella hygida]|uniref:Uncharacterized protein n=1 Tax=Pseudolycoriella hygida TaxID=35572 RepID=A0A9Q0S7Y4_9DIPT|nr:hypothetical protein Bhyg_03945 [Pseudolycoriella hygida]